MYLQVRRDSRALHVPARTCAQAFFVAALLEETMKLRLARRAVHFESALSADAILLHALAASTAFASLENVFYLSAPDGVGFVTVLVRCVVGVPCHAAEGIISAAGLVLHRMSANGRDGTIGWREAFHILWPSVTLHGLWDAFTCQRQLPSLKSPCASSVWTYSAACNLRTTPLACWLRSGDAMHRASRAARLRTRRATRCRASAARGGRPLPDCTLVLCD